jgi:hypothetical protein
MAAARNEHTATRLLDGKVLVAGGYTASGSTTSAELYDPSSGSWSATGSMHGARQGQTATLLPDGRVLVAGGSDGDAATAELYDPRSGTWTPTGETEDQQPHRTRGHVVARWQGARDGRSAGRPRRRFAHGRAV